MRFRALIEAFIIEEGNVTHYHSYLREGGQAGEVQCMLPLEAPHLFLKFEQSEAGPEDTGI